MFVAGMPMTVERSMPFPRAFGAHYLLLSGPQCGFLLAPEEADRLPQQTPWGGFSGLKFLVYVAVFGFQPVNRITPDRCVWLWFIVEVRAYDWRRRCSTH